MIGTNIHPRTTRVYSCDELGACQLRTPRCEGCTVARHCYPQPRKALRFAPGVIDKGAKRARFEWLTTQRAVSAWEFLKGLFTTGLFVIVLLFVLGWGTGWGQRFLAWLGA
jgi:hypothetical protein